MIARKIERATFVLALAVVGLLAAAPAWCKDEYDAPAREAQTPWKAIICAAILLAAIAVVGFKHARRTHLD